jgi:hypothetical protein
MRKILLLSLFLTFLISTLNGQYMRQAGLRSGYRGGLFYQATSETGNAETGYIAMLGFNNNGMQLTGLRIVYETSLSDISPDLWLVWGYGAHAGFVVTDHLSYFGRRYNFGDERFCPLFGADGWAAAEYRFREVPVVVNLNVKPFIELTIPGFVRLIPFDMGISVSYAF